VLGAKNLKVALAAPTGRAAKRLAENTKEAGQKISAGLKAALAACRVNKGNRVLAADGRSWPHSSAAARDLGLDPSTIRRRCTRGLHGWRWATA
jgi:hypothetical protein